jgi:hypothetical protein
MARFYFDEDISFQVIDLLRAVGHDVETVDDSELREAKDHEQLLHAFQSDRLFVTHNSKDFVLLHHAWTRWSAAWNVNPPRMHPASSSFRKHRFLCTAMPLSYWANSSIPVVSCATKFSVGEGDLVG